MTLGAVTQEPGENEIYMEIIIGKSGHFPMAFHLQ